MSLKFHHYLMPATASIVGNVSVELGRHSKCGIFHTFFPIFNASLTNIYDKLFINIDVEKAFPSLILLDLNNCRLRETVRPIDNWKVRSTTKSKGWCHDVMMSWSFINVIMDYGCKHLKAKFRFPMGMMMAPTTVGSLRWQCLAKKRVYWILRCSISG